jgi:hypothetical protein
MSLISYSHIMLQQGLPRRFLRRALIDQQLWFLGRDICASGGNALLAFGFERQRPPAGVVGSSSYVLPSQRIPNRLHEDDVLICWGFALYLGPMLGSAGCAPEAADGSSEARGLIVERFGSSPRLTRAPVRSDIHHVTALPAATPAVTEAQRRTLRHRLVALSDVMASYERWARTHLGVAHRAAALREVPRHKRQRFADATDLAGAWQQVARAVDPPHADSSADRVIAA